MNQAQTRTTLYLAQVLQPSGSKFRKIKGFCYDTTYGNQKLQNFSSE